MKSTIYTLELENGKYYVGRTNVPKQRILKHFQEEGSEWTKLHKPVRILSQVKGDKFDEEKYTLIAMENYGIDNVRGGSYCKIELPQHEKDKALQTIRSITDKCYKCGKKGHFAKDCNNDNCINNEDSDDDIEDNINLNIDNEHCKKCGWVHFKKNELCDGTYCGACGGSGESYWSDDCYGTCLECCCINCGKKDRECQCRQCETCKEIIMIDEKHDNCYLCEKCNNYNTKECNCFKCIKCQKYSYNAEDTEKCWDCYFQDKFNKSWDNYHGFKK
jgi:hypothetical protein